MAARTVCIIQGHPHAEGRHLCHALGDAYAEGAGEAGANVRRVDLGAMDIPLLRDPAEFAAPAPKSLADAQQAIAVADHLVVIFPLWLGSMPALTKAFFEQVCRAGFALETDAKGGWPIQKLKGKTARVIVTMGMPAAAFRLMFGAHGVESFSQSILGLAGVKPVRETLLGGVGQLSPAKAAALLGRMRRLGARLG
jgi:putative NADPH-quinone reductase